MSTDSNMNLAACPLVDGRHMSNMMGARVRLIGKLSGSSDDQFHIMAPDGEQILCKPPAGSAVPSSTDIVVVEVIGKVTGERQVDLEAPAQVHKGGDVDLPMLAQAIALQQSRGCRVVKAKSSFREASMVEDDVVSLSSSESEQPRPSHAAAGEALRKACRLVLDDLVRREQSPTSKEGECPSSYLDTEERGLLEGVLLLGLDPLRRLAALAGRKWPKWHLSEVDEDEELFNKGYIYHTGLSTGEEILSLTEPDPLFGFKRLGWAPEKTLWGGSLMDNLLQSLDRKALMHLATRLGLPTTGSKGQLLKAVRSEFNGRQRRLGDAKVLDMSTVLSKLQHPPYIRLRVATVRALAAMTALVEVMGTSPIESRVSGASPYKLTTLPVSLVLSIAGQFRTAFPKAMLSTAPWLWNREEYELLQVASYGSYLYDCGPRNVAELASLGQAIMAFMSGKLEAITARLEDLEDWQRRLTCWYGLVSVVWHSVWAMERLKQWEQAVTTLHWLLQDIPSTTLHSPSRLAKYLNRLRIDYGHAGRSHEFKEVLGKFIPPMDAVEDLDSRPPVGIILPEPERKALLGGAHPDIVVNEYHIVNCGANRSYGWVEAATLDHIGWPGVHDEGGLVRRLMALLLWEDLVNDAIQRGTVVTPCQPFPGDIYVEGYLDRAAGVKTRLEEISSWERHVVAMEVLRASEAIGRSGRLPPLRFAGLRWTEAKDSSSSPPTANESSTSMDAWSPESAATLAQCLGGALLARLFRRILSDMRYWGGGMPDLTIWQGEQQHARFVEVKGPGDDLSARQRGWIAELMRCGADAEVAYIVEPGRHRPKKRKRK
ncbi:Fanconi-associated nuclease 1 [Perkinsus chesapeaki]|uniref:Fanconi-associated nuclease n=1 Tax=Perkinsus chesapeaki TaxID=330153 RepID=A0A7J6N0P9_PERCH|nr:Fanconi-associated nuclease 1 [Perkinsus chesapeaki]